MKKVSISNTTQLLVIMGTIIASVFVAGISFNEVINSAVQEATANSVTSEQAYEIGRQAAVFVMEEYKEEAKKAALLVDATDFFKGLIQTTKTLEEYIVHTEDTKTRVFNGATSICCTDPNVNLFMAQEFKNTYGELFDSACDIIRRE